MKQRNQLEVTTPSDREIVMTRVFEAPRSLVWDALTRPDLVKRWLGIHGGWVFEICEIDLRVGGAYRYFWRHPSGRTLGIRGSYREIAPLERIVTTETFDGAPHPGEAIATVDLVEEEGKTTLVQTVLAPSREIRDGVLKSGMTRGVEAAYDKLEDLLPASSP